LLLGYFIGNEPPWSGRENELYGHDSGRTGVVQPLGGVAQMGHFHPSQTGHTGL